VRSPLCRLSQLVGPVTAKLCVLAK